MNRVRPSLLLAPFLLVMLAFLSACAGLAGEPQPMLTIDGVTTRIDASQMPFVFIESMGSTSLQGNPNFRMDEWIVPTPILLWNPDGFAPNFGVISMPSKEPNTGSVCIGFIGQSMNGTVQGVFRAIETAEACPSPLAPVYWTIDGIFAGSADVCDMDCTPLLDSDCPQQIDDPSCTGFAVEFSFF